MTEALDYEDYRGCQTTTKSGYTCQAWNKQSPHAHSMTPASKDNYGVGEHNYCRNPDGSDTIWCYTTSPSKRWEYCDSIKCEGSESYSGGSINYRGCQETTKSGYTCQAWTEQSPHTHSMK